MPSGRNMPCLQPASRRRANPIPPGGNNERVCVFPSLRLPGLNLVGPLLPVCVGRLSACAKRERARTQRERPKRTPVPGSPSLPFPSAPRTLPSLKVEESHPFPSLHGFTCRRRPSPDPESTELPRGNRPHSRPITLLPSSFRLFVSLSHHSLFLSLHFVSFRFGCRTTFVLVLLVLLACLGLIPLFGFISELGGPLRPGYHFCWLISHITSLTDTQVGEIWSG